MLRRAAARMRTALRRRLRRKIAGALLCAAAALPAAADPARVDELLARAEASLGSRSTRTVLAQIGTALSYRDATRAQLARGIRIRAQLLAAAGESAAAAAHWDYLRRHFEGLAPVPAPPPAPERARWLTREELERLLPVAEELHFEMRWQRPEFPARLEAVRGRADVLISFLVLSDGATAAISVIEAPHPLLAAAAIDAVAKSRADPRSLRRSDPQIFPLLRRAEFHFRQREGFSLPSRMQKLD